MKVGLFGTCANSPWREEIKPKLKCQYFDPVVPNWTPECIEEENRQKKICDKLLFVITPEMTGVYSIAEVVDASNKYPAKVVLCLLESYNKKNFDKSQWKSLQAVASLVAANGADVVFSLDSVVNYLNQGLG